MRILVAPDKFKGSLGASEVAESIAAGLRDVLPKATIEIMPVADGGEGTTAVIARACDGEWVDCPAHDALGRAITARYAWLPDRMMAVMEMSEAAGLWRIAPEERDPLHAHTGGVGEMLLAAASRGAVDAILGLGGSATNDGGFGMARALGYRFFADDLELMDGPSDLIKLSRIVRGEKAQAPLRWPRIVVASDVRNPLLGARGATHTFGPQKGVGPDRLDLVEEALGRMADIVERDLGCDFREVAGAGAAGGLGFGLMSFCGATIRPGFDLVAEIIDLEAAIRRADVVITGEGRLDSQTLEGKAPAGVASMARRLGKPVHAIVGVVGDSSQAKQLFDSIVALSDGETSQETALANAPRLLRDRARALASDFGLRIPEG